MSRFAMRGFAVMLLALAGSVGVAAPVPKDAGKNDPTPDLKAVFDVVEKAVKAKKWPKEDDESLLRGSAQVTFDRALRGTEQKARKLPVQFKELKRLGPVKEFKGKDVDDGFLIAGDARELNVHDSVVFATGQVEIRNATNSVIFGRHVRCIAAENCLIVASDYIGVTTAWRPFDTEGSVLVAGQWIRTSSLDRTICHVLRPGKETALGDGMGEVVGTAIRTNIAKGAIFLNAKDDVSTSEPKDCKYLPQQNPIAK